MITGRRGASVALAAGTLVVGVLAGGNPATADPGTVASHPLGAPSESAPMSAWEAWSQDQEASAHSIPSKFEVNGCRTSGVQFTTTEWAGGVGIPAGVDVTTSSFKVSCPDGVTAPTPGQLFDNEGESSAESGPTNLSNLLDGREQRRGGTLEPALGSCSTITGPGSLCISEGPKNGAPTVFASYLYQGSSSALGHIELDATGGLPCFHGGTLLRNGADLRLFNGEEEVVTFPFNISTQWTATWWEKVGSNYSNWGTHCDQF